MEGCTYPHSPFLETFLAVQLAAGIANAGHVVVAADIPGVLGFRQAGNSPCEDRGGCKLHCRPRSELLVICKL